MASPRPEGRSCAAPEVADVLVAVVMFGHYALPAFWLFPPRLGAAVRPRPDIANALRSVALVMWIDRSGFRVPDSWAPEIGSRGCVTPVQRGVTKVSCHSVGTVPPLAVYSPLRVAGQEARGAKVDQSLPGRVDRDSTAIGDVPLTRMPLGRHLEATREVQRDDARFRRHLRVVQPRLARGHEQVSDGCLGMLSHAAPPKNS